MIKIIPTNTYILCQEHIEDVVPASSSPFIYTAETVKLYDIIECDPGTTMTYGIGIGDVVLTDATGTTTEINGKKVILFNPKNIVGKISTNE